ncbi:MADS-box protein AGL42-like [Bidens hawaiensis]|uniref:MADS-box protein AGL42-like n=1 Tax=Bidens hawaiensis TaxID=980011 RepID=UPI00404A775C
MVRGKVELKRIENTTSRQVTFSKRRNGLLKKAGELSVLCDADVALIIFSEKGKFYEFASSNMQKIIQKYREYVKMDDTCNPETEVHTQQLKQQDAARIQQDIQQLEASKRNFLGQDLVSCSLDEISELGSKLEHALRFVRAKKASLFKAQVENLKAKERCHLEENARLWQEKTSLGQKFTKVVARNENITEVNTDLLIGLRLS